MEQFIDGCAPAKATAMSPCPSATFVAASEATDTKVPSQKESCIIYDTKLQRAQPRIMILLACVAYLVTAFAAISIGVSSVSNFIFPQLERAHVQATAQLDAVWKENLLADRLDKLLSSQLVEGGFMESHEECLVRGLEAANYQLVGLGLQYPHIREQVMDWVMEECGRLQYTPQVVIANPTPQQAALTYLSQAKYRSRRLAEKAVSYFKQIHLLDQAVGYMTQKTNWIWGRLFNTSNTQDSSAPEDPFGSAHEAFKNVSSDKRFLTEMPFGFNLQCELSQPCRLFFPAANNQINKETVTREAIAKTTHKFKELTSFAVKLNTVEWAITQLVRALVSVQVVLTVVGSVSQAILRSDPSRKRTPSVEAKYTAVSMGVEVLTVLAAGRTDVLLPRSSSELSIIFGIFMSLFGSIMLIRFLIPGPKVEDAIKALETMGELCFILRGRDTPGEKKPAPNKDSKKANDNTDQATQEEKELASLRAPRTPSKPHYCLADPTTTVQEDMHEERRAILEEQVNRLYAAMESDVDSESDTDVDSNPEDRGFVDLATGVTPSVTETESDWSLVDA